MVVVVVGDGDGDGSRREGVAKGICSFKLYEFPILFNIAR